MLVQNGDKKVQVRPNSKPKGTTQSLTLIHSVQRNVVTYFTHARISAQKGTPNEFQ